MRVPRARIGKILELRRSPVDVQASQPYSQIGVRGFGRGIFEYDLVPGSELGKLRYFDVEPSRLVVSNIKGWEGAVAVTSEREHGRIASNRFLTYAATSDDLDLNYVLHWLLSEPGIHELGRASPGSADRNRTLSIKNFEAIEVPLPKIDEQRRIAAHLDSVGHRVRSIRSLQTRGPFMQTLKNLAADRIPALANETWTVDVHFKVRGGGTPDPLRQDLWDGEVPWVTPSDIGPLRTRGIRSGARDVSERFIPAAGLIPAGSVVMTSRAPIGNLAIAEVPLLTNQGCKSFVPLIEIEPLYLYFAVMAVRNSIASVGSGTTFQEVSARVLSELPLPGCSIPEQRRVGSELAKIQSRLWKMQDAARRADVATASILPAARNEIFSAMR